MIEKLVGILSSRRKVLGQELATVEASQDQHTSLLGPKGVVV
jgi:hypothetical protein